MKKLPIILGLATLTAGAYTGAMISVDNANAQTQDNQPAEERPVETKKDINNLVINNIPNQFYTREAITPTIVILEVEKQLIEGTDFEVEYSNNINVGTATATITFIGDYAELESITKNFDIVSGFLANAISTTKSTGRIGLSSVENLTEGLVVDFYQGLDLILEEATITSINLETNSIYTDKSLSTTFIVYVSSGDVEMFVHNSKSTRAINSWITEPSFTPGNYFNAQEFEMILDNYYSGGNGAGHLDLGEATYGDIIVEVKPQNSNSAYVVMMKKSWMEANNSDDDFGMIAWNNEHEDGGVRPDSWLVAGKTITVRFRVDQGNDYFGLTKTIDITIPYIFNISDAGMSHYYDGNEQSLSLTIQDAESEEYLIEGVDFTITYSNNINIGTATATVNFIGNYAGAFYTAYYLGGEANGNTVYLTTEPFTLEFEIEVGYGDS